MAASTPEASSATRITAPTRPGASLPGEPGEERPFAAVHDAESLPVGDPVVRVQELIRGGIECGKLSARQFTELQLRMKDLPPEEHIRMSQALALAINQGKVRPELNP